MDLLAGPRYSEEEIEKMHEERRRRQWQNLMDGAGIPPRHQEAHLKRNCGALWNYEEKRTALSLAQELVENGHILQRDRKRYCLLIKGDFGTGKTWLATATFKEMLWRERSGLWTKYWAFIGDIQDTYGTDRSTMNTRRKYQHTPVLMLDDIGDLQNDETQDRRYNLFKVLDHRNDHLLPTIMTTNLGKARLIEQFGERTWERIKQMAALSSMEGDNLRDNPID